MFTTAVLLIKCLVSLSALLGLTLDSPKDPCAHKAHTSAIKGFLYRCFKA